VRVHGIPPAFGATNSARSSKRTVRLISGVALDECLDPERYRTRAPAFALRATARQAILHLSGYGPAVHFKPLNAKQIERPGAFISFEISKAPGVSRWKRPARGLFDFRILIYPRVKMLPMQQPAGFICKEIMPGQHRLEVPPFSDMLA
jgi:hypothetical protein